MRCVGRACEAAGAAVRAGWSARAGSAAANLVRFELTTRMYLLYLLYFLYLQSTCCICFNCTCCNCARFPFLPLLALLTTRAILALLTTLYCSRLGEWLQSLLLLPFADETSPKEKDLEADATPPPLAGAEGTPPRADGGEANGSREIPQAAESLMLLHASMLPC